MMINLQKICTSVVSYYPVLMLNLIWFAEKKCLSFQHWATWGHEIRHIMIQKRNHFASSVC